MHKDFIAIGVAQGDAFMVKTRDHFVALIDGGRSVAGFYTEFQRATKRNSVDVVVCTHNDADHANGVIGFLQSGLHCKEVWLPASWAGRLNDLFDPVKFARELVDDVARLDHAEIAEIRDADTFFERFASGREADNIEGTEEAVDAEVLMERTLEQDKGDYIELRDALFYWGLRPPFFPMLQLEINDTRFRLLVETIAAGERIKQIAQLAFHRGCRIRWFEYSHSNPSGGIPGKLVPVNAREVHKVKMNKSSALMYLAFTITNKQSLVLCSPQDSGAPAVLFTADSDLSFPNTIPWSDGMIITAPHHGSEANAAAYRRFQREMPSPVSTAWVRSDGRFKSRPGRSFLNLRGTSAVFCTFCRCSLHPKQDLVFTASGQNWNPVNTQSCSCR